MRKFLIGFLVILLIIMAYLVIFKGLTLGNFKVLSASQIIEENDKLTKEISDTEVLMNSVYPQRYEVLNTSVSKLLTAKNEYKDLADVSTKAELSKASVTETYTVEFLWTVLGRHATAEGVNLNYTPKNNSINFTVTGDYIPIFSFVSAIENDSRLGFRIENFKLTPAADNLLQATFITRNVTVKTERADISTQTTNTTNTTQNTTTNQTKTETTSQ